MTTTPTTIAATVKTPPHTPLPYLRDGALIYALDESQTCNRITLRVDGGFVMNWKNVCDRTTGEEIEATADFVHRACNSHYQLVEALEWYAEQARLCRLIHSEGDSGRAALSDDGGKRARAALSAATGEA